MRVYESAWSAWDFNSKPKGEQIDVFKKGSRYLGISNPPTICMCTPRCRTWRTKFGWASKAYLAVRSVGRSDGRSVGRSDGRSDGRSVGRSDGRTVGRSVGRSVGLSDEG